MSCNNKKWLAEIPDETHAAKFLQKVGILHTERFCCGVKMRPEEKKVREKLVPMWRCSSCHSRKGIRADTWLDPSKLPLDTIVEFIYWWSRENASMKFCEFELGMNHSTTGLFNVHARGLRELRFAASRNDWRTEFNSKDWWISFY